MSTAHPPIDITGLVKTFGRVRALDGLDLTVRAGEVHGFLGPNGAGKSTTIRVLLGLLRTDAGEVRLLGGDPWRDAAELHRRLAYVPGDVNLWPNLTGGEAIDLLGRLRGGLDPNAGAPTCSSGFELDPTQEGPQPTPRATGRRSRWSPRSPPTSSCCVLDEPTSGLDPLMEAVFQDVRRARSRDRGRTVLLSSHILAEVEALCDRVSIIRDRAHRRDRHPRRAAPPHPDVDHGRDSAPAGGRLRDIPACTTCMIDGNRAQLRRRHRRPRRGARHPAGRSACAA